MSDIILFGNSSCFRRVDTMENQGDDKSYMMRLFYEQGATGIWNPGLTILHVMSLYKYYHRAGCTIILHVGVCESVTHAPLWFMTLASMYLETYGWDSFFGVFVAPRMSKVAHAAYIGNDTYTRFLEPEHFRYLLDIFLKATGNAKVLVMGLVKPNIDKKHLRYTQSKEYDVILKEVSESNSNATFIDVWSIGNSFDERHLTEKGHALVYDKIIENL